MALLSIILICGALLETAATGMMLPFMNTVMSPETIGESQYRQIAYRLFNCQSTSDFLILMSVMLAVVYVVKAIYNMLSIRVQQRFLTNTQTNLTARLFDCFMKKSFSYHLQHSSAELYQGINDVATLIALVQGVLLLISETLVALFMLLLLISVNPMLTLVAGVLIGASLICLNFTVSKRIKTAGEDQRGAYVLRYKAMTNGADGFKSIKVNRAEQMFVNSFAKHDKEMCQASKRYQVLSSVPRLTVEAVSMAGIFLFMALLVGQGTNLDQMLPLFATFALAAVRIMPSATRIVSAYNTITFNRVALAKVYENLVDSGIDMQTEVNVVTDVPELEKTLPFVKGVSVHSLSFKYDDADNYLFQNVSFEIPAQKATAFVGATGSGKTTMADIILGLHTPCGGEVLADGHNIHNEPDWWAQRIGYIPQNIFLCDDTIRSNVAFGREPDSIDENKVWECLEQAQMREFVEALPKGLDTVVGDNGVRLSGGQRQRIGIARALYTDPQLLVMDEATSALDNDTEQAIIDAVNKLAGHKTLLIIAHRLTTIKDCDIVYRVENGKVERER